MLQCPLCATRYADGTSACPLDQRELLPVPPPGEYGPRWSADSRAAALSISSRGSATLPPPGASSGDSGAAAETLLGQTLGGKLRVQRRIGQGGMGTVYVAEHLGLGKPVAVKVLSPQYAEHGTRADLVHRLHTEARHTAAIKNEHIVDIFDIGTTEDGRPYVEMELLTGESLAQRLARCSALSEADTLHLGRQLASALAAAHKSGIVHRDIKPENIFLCDPAAYGKDPSDGDFVKVLDFGISKAVRALETDAPSADEATPATRPSRETRDPRLTRTGAILGTPLYMSPEQVRGELLDHRVDVYAVGVVLYECLTGSVPHGACNYLAVVAKILTEAPEPPSLRSPERAISPELEHIVLRAMAKGPDERYPTMEAVLEDLRRYAAGQELLPRPGVGDAGSAGSSAGSYGAPAALQSGLTPAGTPGLGDGGGALGHLWRPILVGMVLVLGLGGGVAAVLRPRGPWSVALTAPTSRAGGRTEERGARPGTSFRLPAAHETSSVPSHNTGLPAALVDPAAAQKTPSAPSHNAGFPAAPVDPMAAQEVPSEASHNAGFPGEVVRPTAAQEVPSVMSPAAGLPVALGRPTRATSPTSLRTASAGPAADADEGPAAHRTAHPRPPAAVGGRPPAASGPGDALLLDEQAPNPFVAPSAPGRADPPRRGFPAADDTSADPR